MTKRRRKKRRRITRDIDMTRAPSDMPFSRHQRSEKDRGLVALFRHRIECGLSNAVDGMHWVSVGITGDGCIKQLSTECGVDNVLMDTLERMECDSCTSVAKQVREAIESGDRYTDHFGRTVPKLLQAALGPAVASAIGRHNKREYRRQAQNKARPFERRESVLEERVKRASDFPFGVRCHEETGRVDKLLAGTSTSRLLAIVDPETRKWEIVDEVALERWFMSFEDEATCVICDGAAYSNMKQHTRTKKHRNKCRLAIYKALPAITLRGKVKANG